MQSGFCLTAVLKEEGIKKENPFCLVNFVFSETGDSLECTADK